MGRTITLDDDVAERLDREAQRTGASPQEIVNTTLRSSLKDLDIKPAPFKIRPRHMGWIPGLNFDCTERLLDEIEGPDWK